MYLSLYVDATEVLLHGTAPVLGCSYFPQPGEGDKVVTETATVILEGTLSDIRTRVNAIGKMLELAAFEQEAINTPVYIAFRPDNSGLLYRSRVRGGRVVFSKEPAKHDLHAVSNTVEIAVIWTRDNFWEGEETEIFLSSASQSERQGGVTCYNNDNATSNNNYVRIANNRVTGEMPTPLRLRIINNAGTALAWTNFYICNNTFSTPDSTDVWLLGSEAVSGATMTWGGAITHNNLLFVFPLDSTLLGYTKGRLFRAVTAFSSASAGVWLRAAIYSKIGLSYYPLVVGREIYNGSPTSYKLMDLGSFPLPPGGYNVSTGGAALAISGRTSLAGSATVDFVNLMATDSFCRLEQIGYSLANGDSVYVDGIDGGAYAYDGTKYPIVKQYNDAIQAWPGYTQRLHVLFAEGTTFTAGRGMKLQAWYRPRVRTI